MSDAGACYLCGTTNGTHSPECMATPAGVIPIGMEAAWRLGVAAARAGLLRPDGPPEKLVSPWIPEQRPLALAALGKLSEELGEASAITSRCIIQGIDQDEPVTHRVNKAALQDEIADVIGCAAICSEYFGFNEARMEARSEAKMEHMRRWFALIRAKVEQP